MSDLSVLSPFAVPLAAVFGLLVGSFLNVVIYRVPVMMERGWTVFAKEYLNLPLTEEESRTFNLISAGRKGIPRPVQSFAGHGCAVRQRQAVLRRAPEL